MDFCSVKSERLRSSSSKRLQKCNLCQKLGHHAFECSASRPVSRNTERSDRTSAKKGNGRGSNTVAKSQKRGGPSKNGRG